MKPLPVWILSVAAIAAAIVVFLSALRDSSDIAVHRRVAYRSSIGEHRTAEFSPADSYSVIWEKQESPAEPESVPSHGISEQFTLRSVFLVKSGDSVQGFAAIEIGREEHLYPEGTVLAGGYRLLAVNAGGIVLERNGRRYTLPLEGAPEPFSEPISTASTAAQETTAVSIAEPEIDAVEPAKFVDPSGMPADRIVVPAEVWNYAVNNMHKILRHVRVRTDLAGGDMKGLWIDPHKNSLPYKFGFRIGDIIRSIDGKSIKSIKDVMELYQEALRAPPERMRVIFERNKKLRVREIRIWKPPG